MSTIYLDESGDLGFSFEKNSSKYFVIALFETSLTEKELKKIIKIAKERTIKNKKAMSNEIKGSDSKFETKEFLLKKLLLAEPNFKISSIIVNKEKINDDLRDKKRIFYNYICKEILKENNYTKINLIFDKKDRKNKFTSELNKYLEENFANKNLDLKHEYSHNYYGLQIADIMANSIFKKFEHYRSALC